MDRNEVFGRVRAIVQQVTANKLPDEAITPETRIVEDLGIDSVTFVTLIICLEDAFGITIEDELAILDRVATCGNIAAHITAMGQ